MACMPGKNALTSQHEAFDSVQAAITQDRASVDSMKQKSDNALWLL